MMDIEVAFFFFANQTFFLFALSLSLPYELFFCSELALGIGPTLCKSAWSCLYEGIWHRKKKDIRVVIKCTHQKQAESCDDGQREIDAYRYLLKTRGTFFPVIKLLAYVKTETLHVFVLKRGRLDLCEFLQTPSSPSFFKNIYAQSRCIYLMARPVFELHRRNMAHGDLSPENYMFVTDSRDGEKSLVLIDLATSQYQFDITNEFHVNNNLGNCMDGRRPGKSNYHCKEIDSFRPWNLTKNDLVCFATIVFMVMTSNSPFVFDGTPRYAHNIEWQLREKFLNGTHPEFKNEVFKDFSMKLTMSNKKFFDRELMSHPLLSLWRDHEVESRFF